MLQKPVYMCDTHIAGLFSVYNLRALYLMSNYSISVILLSFTCHLLQLVQ